MLGSAPRPPWPIAASSLNPAAAYRRAGAVALVRVTAITATDARGRAGAVATVAEAWRSPLAAEIRLTGTGTNCDLSLEAGGSYLLFLPPGPGPHPAQRCGG